MRRFLFLLAGFSVSVAHAGGGGDDCYGIHTVGETLYDIMLPLSEARPEFRFLCKEVRSREARVSTYVCEYPAAQATFEITSMPRPVAGSGGCSKDGGPTWVSVSSSGGRAVSFAEIFRHALAFEVSDLQARCETRKSRTVCYTASSNVYYGLYFILDRPAENRPGTVRASIYRGGVPEEGHLDKAFEFQIR